MDDPSDVPPLGLRSNRPRANSNPAVTGSLPAATIDEGPVSVSLRSLEKRFVCRGVLSTDNLWGCGRCFARADVLGRHFRSEPGRVCIKPLLEEEATKQQRQWAEEQAQQQMESTQDMIASSPLLTVKSQLHPILPTGILQMYPELASFDWDPDGSGFDGDQSVIDDVVNNDSIDIVAVKGLRSGAPSSPPSSEDGSSDFNYSGQADSSLIETSPTSFSRGVANSKPEHFLVKVYPQATHQVTMADDTCSLASENEDIGSLADSVEFSEPRTTAIKYLAKMFLKDAELENLLKEAHDRMGSEKFVRNHRRLLKTYFLRGLSSSPTRSQGYALSILRSRRRRIELSNLLFQKFASESSHSMIELEQEVDKLSIIDKFLASQEDQPSTILDHDNDNDSSGDNDDCGSDGDNDDGVALDHLAAATDFMTSASHFQAYRVELGNFLDTLQPQHGSTIETVPVAMVSTQTFLGRVQNSGKPVQIDPDEGNEHMPSPSPLHEHPDLYISEGESNDTQSGPFDRDEFPAAANDFDELIITARPAPPMDMVEDHPGRCVVEAKKAQTSFAFTSQALNEQSDYELQIHDRYMRTRIQELV